MTRLFASRGSRGLVGALILLACTGANCQQIVPQPRFLLLEPIELGQSGFCQDWGPGLAFHQGEDCFRRENCLFDCPQICVGDDGNSNDSHDTVSPVIGTAPNGRCLYDMPWDPVGGLFAHPAWWAHAIFDVVFPSLFAGC